MLMTSTTMSLVDLVRDVARERIAPGAVAVDAERAFPRAAIDALAEQGAPGLMVPASAGGAGGGLSALVEACEAVGGACASSGMVFLMHCVTAATVAAGGGERATGYLERMAAGEVLGSYAGATGRPAARQA
jgi:acyl-CoA dehydrogenase